MPREEREFEFEETVADDEPCYVISIAARLVGMHQQTLRYYERAGLIRPKRTAGNIRMYSNRDIQRIREAQRLIDQLGVNLAGVDVILRMRDQMREMQKEIERLRAELERLRARRLPAPIEAQVIEASAEVIEE